MSETTSTTTTTKVTTTKKTTIDDQSDRHPVNGFFGDAEFSTEEIGVDFEKLKEHTLNHGLLASKGVSNKNRKIMERKQARINAKQNKTKTTRKVNYSPSFLTAYFS